MTQEINNRWFGVLTDDNIEAVVVVVREILKGRLAIAEALYCDGVHADLRLISADCEIDSRWTSQPYNEAVRLFTAEDGRKWFGFSAGGYLWTFSAQPDASKDHEDYHYPYFSFEYDKFTVIHRAPAGKGYLHKRVFGAHRPAEEVLTTKEGE